MTTGAKGQSGQEEREPTSTKNLRDTSQLNRGHPKIHHSKGSNSDSFKQNLLGTE